MEKRVLLIIEGDLTGAFGKHYDWLDNYLNAFPLCQFGILHIQNRRRSAKGFVYDMQGEDFPSNVSFYKTVNTPAVSRLLSEYQQKFLKEWLEETHQQVYEFSLFTDFIHATNSGLAGLTGSFIKVRTGRPLMVTEHQLYWKAINSGIQSSECSVTIPENIDSRRSLRHSFQNISRSVYRYANHIVTAYSSNRYYQNALGGEDVTYIPDGVEADNLRFAKKTRSNSSRLTVGWIGTAEAKMNPQRFLDLADMMNQRAESREYTFRFKMFLTPNGFNELEKDIRKRASFIPNLEIYEDHSLPEALDHIDAVCITAEEDHQYRVALEAAAARVLPFGWKNGDLNRSWGCFVNKHYPASKLANRLIKQWKDSIKWDFMRDKLFDRIRRRHSWKVLFEKYSRIIEKMSNKNELAYYE